MRTITQFIMFGLIVLGAAADTANAAPAGLPNRPLDLELREAKIADVFRLLADVSQKNVELDPCVQGTVDLKLKNAPIPVVFDVLATKLSLRYETHADSIFVACQKAGDATAPEAPDARLERHVSIDTRDTPARTVLEQIAKAAGLEGVDYRADEAVRLTLSVRDIRLITMIDAISDQTALHIEIVKGRLVVTAR